MVGGLVTPLPGGDAAQRAVDTWAWQMGNDLKAEQDAKTNAEISDHYFKANNQTKLMVDQWAEQRGIDTGTDKGANLSVGWAADMLNGHDRGGTLAGKYLKNG